MRESPAAKPAAPAVAVTWLRDPEQRREWLRFWIRDPFFGVIDIALHSTFRLIPIDWGSAIGGWLGVLAGRYRFRGGYVRARQNYLRLAPSHPSEPEADAAMVRLWGHMGRIMAEFSTVHRLWAAGRISVDGAEHLTAARAAGKPLLVTALHLGNWEVIGPTLIALGYTGSDIYQPPRSRFEERIALASRRRYGGGGAILLRAGVAAARQAHRTLVDDRGLLVMFVDEEQRDYIHAPLFGRPLQRRANIKNAVRLAAASGAAVIPVYVERLGGARFRVNFLPPADLLSAAPDDPDALLENVQRLDRLITPIILARLDQWFWLPTLRLD